METKGSLMNFFSKNRISTIFEDNSQTKTDLMPQMKLTVEDIPLFNAEDSIIGVFEFIIRFLPNFLRNRHSY